MIRAELTTVALSKNEIAAQLPALAQLRIKIFRSWPYLYDGDLDYERRYLESYLKMPGTYVAGTFDDERLVGATTAMPLGTAHSEFAEPMVEAGHQAQDWFYFGESLLLSAYRGQGIGRQYFEMREAEARRQGFSRCTFCAVRRPDQHPLRPRDATSLEAFWRSCGYTPLKEVTAGFSWKDVDQPEETVKPMDYWSKTLPNDP